MANLSNKVSPLGVAVNESPTFTGGITVTGTVAATDFTGDGSTLTGITTLTGTETLTNKTVALGTNSISGTTAQFNTALTDGNFATLAGTETLTNKTLTSAILGGTTTAGPINVTGTVAATDFTGDGSALTGIAAGIEWVLKTTTYTAVTRDAIIANTSGGVWTLTLPATPATGDYVQILDGADWATNNLTVARNGQTVEGEATDLIMNIGGVSVNLIFDGTTWQIAAQVGGNGDGVTLDAPQTLTNKTLTGAILDGIPTAPTATAGTNTTQVATTAFVADTSIGVGQTWQDVSASRAINTSYQNTTGKPIMVAVDVTVNSVFEVSSDNVTFIELELVNQFNGGSWIIPDGYYYRISGGFNRWTELR